MSTIEVITVDLPLPAPSDDICSSCGEPIEEAIAVFSGKGRGHVFHVDCYGSAEPTSPEADRE